MINFIQVADVNCWKIIRNGPQTPQITAADGTVRDATEDEYTDAHWMEISLNAKALNFIHFALEIS